MHLANDAKKILCRDVGRYFYLSLDFTEWAKCLLFYSLSELMPELGKWVFDLLSSLITKRALKITMMDCSGDQIVLKWLNVNSFNWCMQFIRYLSEDPGRARYIKAKNLTFYDLCKTFFYDLVCLLIASLRSWGKGFLWCQQFKTTVVWRTPQASGISPDNKRLSA